MQAGLLENASVVSFAESPVLYVHPKRTSDWLPELPSEVGLSLLRCKRLGARLSLLIQHHYKLSPLEHSNSEDLAIAVLDFDVLARVRILAGAIFHGRRLRMLISGAAIAGLLPGLDGPAYNFAMKHAELAPPLEEEEQAPPTSETISTDGDLCFRAWVNSLPVPIAQRVTLKFPNDFETGPLRPEFELFGPDIVRAAGKGLLDHVQS